MGFPFAFISSMVNDCNSEKIYIENLSCGRVFVFNPNVGPEIFKCEMSLNFEISDCRVKFLTGLSQNSIINRPKASHMI